MPRKVWSSGEVLASADLNDYVGDQVVMTFANEAARTSDLPSPTAGMMTFLVDVAEVQVYDGTEFTQISGGGSSGVETNFLLMGA